MKRMAGRCGKRMGMIVLVLVFLCCGAAGRVNAADEEIPCAAEIAKYCKETKPGGGRVLNCLNEHKKEISDSCRTKLEESNKRLREAQRACTADVEKFCKDVQPGEGRILRCLREHTQELSPACRQVTEKSGEKRQGKEAPRQQ